MFVPIDAFVKTDIETHVSDLEDSVYLSALLQQSASIGGHNVLMHGRLASLDVSTRDIKKLRASFTDYKIALIYV